jgi:DNA-binding response OmpR family regulator
MKKILIIEDEESIRMALEDDFQLENYLVETASNGIEGLAKAENPEIDLIILDIMLPGMNGFEICKKLRTRLIRTPIIMLTAKGQEIDRVVGLEIGADDYVTKPFSPRELQSRVKAILRIKYLIRNRGKVVNRDELLDKVWGKNVFVTPHTVDTHMANLRKKIEDNPLRPGFIISIRSVGYKFTSE